MASLKERLKAKLGRKHTPATPRVETSPTATTPHPRPAPDPARSLPTLTLPERLWNQAYDQANKNDPSTVDAYEKLLSAQLHDNDDDGASNTKASADLASQDNEIAQDPIERRAQMQKLVRDGLRRTEKDADVKQGVEDTIQAAMELKEVVTKAVQASPEAALVWVSVCFALEILMNPLTQASSNRDGIAYVVSRMDWYWNLSSLLLDENMKEEMHSAGLRGELEKGITQLYANLLLYQMKSVCYYNRRRFSVFLRDLMKLDDWDGKLTDIKTAEMAVQEDSRQYNTITIRNRLSVIASAAESQNIKLDSISSAIREQTKQQEKMQETSADYKCLEDLRITNPRDDKKRIEETKGGLLEESYRWILSNTDFKKWRGEHGQLLWIRGDPGKGKTMLLCGIIDELENSADKPCLLSYFFCQATDSRINNAKAILRGLVYMLVDQQPSLISHVRKEHNRAGKSLFEDVNACVALTGILSDILKDPTLNSAYLIVDGLDECVEDLPKLLKFIAQKPVNSSVKWILSSRNWQNIEEELREADYTDQLSLELNKESVSVAVSKFIEHKVLQLARKKGYTDKTRNAVLEYLVSNANDTFLWAALVCKHIESVGRYDVLREVKLFPPDLDSVFARMMTQIEQSNHAERSKQILALVAIVYRPLTLKELGALSEFLTDIDDLDAIREIISFCGSFLTVRENTIYFVHQSAKDFLFEKAFNTIFPSGTESVHLSILSRSLDDLSRSLKRDMYGLGNLECHAEEVPQLDMDSDPLATSWYSCLYWIEHLCTLTRTDLASCKFVLQDEGIIHTFLKTKYLYWLEALSLCKSISMGIVSIGKLAAIFLAGVDTLDAISLGKLAEDARRFILYHGGAIENYPLQTYVSALIFSPTSSLVRHFFKREEPKWVKIMPVGDIWSACLQTLEDHKREVNSITFSHNSTRLASGSGDDTIKIWDAITGTCLQTIEGHQHDVNSVTFSSDSTRLASASSDNTVKIWDVISGACLQTLEGHIEAVNSVAFSHDSNRLASASKDKTIRIWDMSSFMCVQTLEDHWDWIFSVAFSHDSALLVSASFDLTIKIWDAASGACLQTLRDGLDISMSVTFSHNSKLVASASNIRAIKIWDVSSGECLQVIQAHMGYVYSVAFSNDSKWLASASDDNTVKIWDVSSGGWLKTLEGHTDAVKSVAFSKECTRIASASHDKTVKIWDTGSNASLQTLERHDSAVESVSFSHDARQMASASDNTIKIWDTSTGACLKTIKSYERRLNFVKFSHDSTLLVSTTFSDGAVRIWDTSSGELLHALEGHSGNVNSATFSNDSTQLVSASYDMTAKIWDTRDGVCVKTLEGHTKSVDAVAFSHDSTLLASASDDKTIKIWVTSSGSCCQTLEGHTSAAVAIAFSHNSTWLASASWNGTIIIWDAMNGTFLYALEVNATIEWISFDLTSSCLYTDTGTIVGDTSLVPQTTDFTEPQTFEYQGVGISHNKEWITYNNQGIIWLPSEYRPKHSVVWGEKIGIGVASGRVWMCEILGKFLPAQYLSTEDVLV